MINSSSSAALAGLALSLLAGSAHAQTAPAAGAPPVKRPPATDPQGRPITVTGSRPQVIDAPDRLSFNVANDLGAQTGSLADALRNVPGVEVDLQGQVSLRGDPGVTILIDGKPSAMLRGEGRGDALLSMPANRIERVEVITNPSAAFSPEGSGGVINLVTRQARPGGGGNGGGAPVRSASGTVRANAGDKGRGSVSVNGALTRPGTTITAEASLRRFTNVIDVTQQRFRANLSGGAELPSLQESRFDNVSLFRSGRLGIERDFDKRNRLTGEVAFQQSRNRSQRDENYLGNTIEPSFTRQSVFYFRQQGVELRTSYQHSFPEKDHNFVVEGSIERGKIRRGSEGESFFPGQSSITEDIENKGEQRENQVKLEYKKPLAKGRSLTLGYLVNRAEFDFDFTGARGPTSGALSILPGLTNAFDYRQTIHALYGTLQINSGKWEFQPGLRAEQVDLDLFQRTDGRAFDQSYFRLYPTLHVGRALSDRVKLRGSYSRRIQRPGPLDLNPFFLYVDSRNLRQGNPALLPATTDAYELALQFRKDATFASLTAFHRPTRNGVVEIVEVLSDGVIVTGRDNLGRGQRTGVDAILNGRLAKTLTYNVSGTVQRVVLDTEGLGGFEKVSDTVVSGRGNMTWQPSPKDYLQMSFSLSGRQPIPQGYRQSSGVLNLGYRRKISEKVSVLLTGQNVLDSVKQVVVIRTPSLRDRLEQKVNGRVLMAGLSVNFGGGNGKRRPDQGFDFDPGATSVGQ